MQLIGSFSVSGALWVQFLCIELIGSVTMIESALVPFSFTKDTCSILRTVTRALFQFPCVYEGNSYISYV